MGTAGPMAIDVLSVTTVDLVSLTFLLSTIEYMLIGLVIGKAFHGRRLRRFAAARGWECERRDPHRSLGAAAPRVLGKVRTRRVLQTVRGESPQGRFTLWIHRNPRRWRRGRCTVLVEIKMPSTSPGVLINASIPGDGAPHAGPGTSVRLLDQTRTPALVDLIRAHPDVSWDWTGNRLVVSSTKVKGMDALQDLVRAADLFRALAPEAPKRAKATPTPTVVPDVAA